jgi:hypothetical protein
MGVCLGTGVGYICAVLQSVHSLGTDQEGEVVLGIAALRKLETNDVTGAQHVLQWIVAENYLDHIEKRDPWWLQAAYRNSKVVERVERAAKDIPGLAAAIQERKKKKSDQSSPRE